MYAINRINIYLVQESFARLSMMVMVVVRQICQPAGLVLGTTNSLHITNNKQYRDQLIGTLHVTVQQHYYHTVVLPLYCTDRCTVAARRQARH